jgi:hypothetical protein
MQQFDDLQSRPQPYYDFEIAKICTWLKARGLTMHVTLDCKITFRDKITNEIVKL